jgi:hypothetical protein
LKFETTWILLSLSSDNDYHVSYELLEEKYDFLPLLSYVLDTSDDALKCNIIWTFSNLIGERRPDIMKQVIRKTTLLDFLAALMNA